MSRSKKSPRTGVESTTENAGRVKPGVWSIPSVVSVRPVVQYRIQGRERKGGLRTIQNSETRYQNAEWRRGPRPKGKSRRLERRDDVRCELSEAGSGIEGEGPGRNGEKGLDRFLCRTRRPCQRNGPASGLTDAGAGGRRMTHARIRPRPVLAFHLAGPEYTLFRPRPDQDPQLGRGPLLLGCVTHGISLQNPPVLTPGPQRSRLPRDRPATGERAAPVVLRARANSTRLGSAVNSTTANHPKTRRERTTDERRRPQMKEVRCRM